MIHDPEHDPAYATRGFDRSGWPRAAADRLVTEHGPSWFSAAPCRRHKALRRVRELQAFASAVGCD
jgi:hypothetical protein